MKSSAGVAQLLERRRSLSEMPCANPVPRSTSIIQAAGAGLQQDPETRALGRADGAAGLPWRFSVVDLLSGQVDLFAYASGYLEGKRFGP